MTNAKWPDVACVLDDWIEQELRYWADDYTGDRDFSLDFERASESQSIFILDIQQGGVRIRPKRSTVDATGTILGDSQEAIRIGYYRNHIEAAVQAYASHLTTTIALDVHDLPLYRGQGPIFAFQKTAASRAILMPDIDFMQHRWYAEPYSETRFEDKSPTAIFVGASTGGGILNSDDVIRNRPLRLALANAFADDPRITFRIAAISQCDSAETEALLAAKPYHGPHMDWAEQLRCGFAVSVDGNGATCSRVVNSLRSNSVLVKHSSPNLLYYFKGLRPWEHYIPFETAADLKAILDDYLAKRFSPEPIIARANAFFGTFLTKDVVHNYTARLLECYQAKVVGKSAWSATGTSPISSVILHVANVGDVTRQGNSWALSDDARAIEGFALLPKGDHHSARLRYKAIGADKDGDWQSMGGYAGSRGVGHALTGLELATTDGVSTPDPLMVEAVFASGYRVKSDGRAIGDGSALIGFRISVAKA